MQDKDAFAGYFLRCVSMIVRWIKFNCCSAPEESCQWRWMFENILNIREILVG